MCVCLCSLHTIVICLTCILNRDESVLEISCRDWQSGSNIHFTHTYTTIYRLTSHSCSCVSQSRWHSQVDRLYLHVFRCITAAHINSGTEYRQYKVVLRICRAQYMYIYDIPTIGRLPKCIYVSAPPIDGVMPEPDAFMLAEPMHKMHFMHTSTHTHTPHTHSGRSRARSHFQCISSPPRTYSLLWFFVSFLSFIILHFCCCFFLFLLPPSNVWCRQSDFCLGRRTKCAQYCAVQAITHTHTHNGIMLFARVPVQCVHLAYDTKHKSFILR